ncbi:hypothetical protein [Nannocystis pusilla]|uniref:hypothetical protein n=1 Tax=Nannocystis pusilla TaxID=889268 RepID=UPI003BF0C256
MSPALAPCGTYEGDPIAVAVDVTDLTLLDPVYPKGASYIPIDGETAAVVTITADTGAVGSQVRVRAFPAEGVELGGLVGELVATFVAAGDHAEAQLRVTATQPGTFIIQAQSFGDVRTTEVVAAGPPAFVPKSLTLQPGEARDVAVVSDGGLRECWATTELTGLTVTLAGSDIGQAPGAGPDDGDWVLTVTADPMIAADGTGQVLCRDVFIQEGTLALTVDL